MNLFGYFNLGLKAMSAARLGLQVAGDNIANAFTPGYVRRRLELTPGYPERIQGGLVDSGVEVAALRRVEDRFLQANLERELARESTSDQRLRALQSLETIFGPLDGENLTGAMARFARAFQQVAAEPENLSIRREAVDAAESMARLIRNTHRRLVDRRTQLDLEARDMVQEVNRLSGELARLNREIVAEEAGGGTAAPLRDRRDQVVEQLVELTGGVSVPDGSGRVGFHLSGGPTLVTGDEFFELRIAAAPDGTARVLAGAGSADVTDRIRGGRLGATFEVRDETIPGHLNTLDRLAADWIGRANALTTSGFDLTGAPGLGLFEPEPPPAAGAAAVISVNPVLLQDPAALAVSAGGAPGDGTLATELADLVDTASPALGGTSPTAFFSEKMAALGSTLAEADVDHQVAREMADTLRARRDAVSGVSLDEEAAALIRNQRSFEAAARFLQVLNEVSEVALRLVP